MNLLYFVFIGRWWQGQFSDGTKTYLKPARNKSRQRANVSFQHGWTGKSLEGRGISFEYLPSTVFFAAVVRVVKQRSPHGSNNGCEVEDCLHT